MFWKQQLPEQFGISIHPAGFHHSVTKWQTEKKNTSTKYQRINGPYLEVLQSDKNKQT